MERLGLIDQLARDTTGGSCPGPSSSSALRIGELDAIGRLGMSRSANTPSGGISVSPGESTPEPPGGKPAGWPSSQSPELGKRLKGESLVGGWWAETAC